MQVESNLRGSGEAKRRFICNSYRNDDTSGTASLRSLIRATLLIAASSDVLVSGLHMVSSDGGTKNLQFWFRRIDRPKLEVF